MTFAMATGRTNPRTPCQSKPTSLHPSPPGLQHPSDLQEVTPFLRNVHLQSPACVPGILGAGDGGEQDTPPSVCPDCRVVRPPRGRGDRAHWSAACPGSGRTMPGQRLKMQT